MDQNEDFLINSVSEPSMPVNYSAITLTSPTEEFPSFVKKDFCTSSEDLQSSLLYLQNVLSSEVCPYSTLINENNDETCSIVQLVCYRFKLRLKIFNICK